MPEEVLHLLHLPDELLVEVLAKLELKDRHKALPLVCRRLDCLLGSPRLLRHVSLTTELSSLDSARSLLGWLVARCSGHVQQLQLSLRLKGLSDDYHPDDDCSDVTSNLAAALAVCGAAGGLAGLDVELRGSKWAALHIGSWAAALHGLTRLRFAVECQLRTSGRLSGLERLQVLELEGKPTEVATFAAFPASVTHLKLGSTLDNNDEPSIATLPLQVAALTQLRRLSLVEGYHISDAVTANQPLAALAGTLQHLHMEACSLLPRCLGQLQSLRSLVLDCNVNLEWEDWGVLSQALPELRHLSRFVLAPLGQFGDPHWTDDLDAVPPGSWLASLRQLALPAGMLASCLPALTATTQLQHLAVVTATQPGQESAEGQLEAAEAVLRWAAGHTPLRRLVLQLNEAGCPRSLLQLIVEAQRVKPSTLFEFKDDVTAELTGCQA